MFDADLEPSSVVADLAPPQAKPEPAKAPTKKAGRRRVAAPKVDKAPSKGPGRPPRNGLEKRLAEQFTTIGLVVSAINVADGAVIIEHGENVARALDKLAAENPKVQAALDKWLTAGAWSGVATAVAPIVLGIAGNHGVLPGILSGTKADDGAG